ncbi:MAG: transglycosylase SLT domain-containing protein [Deltaproteobacteria bacterium]|nr:transglycosylase SLT domain-containing protein [Deltaproteobacteria bacterium]MBK8718485.1 transglycosylase SLT domain-containing protein [Deltaproteobacteria bacterium]MBP7288548.1 transglycosylase SLT domain-containing protein [Nannocystaceae bacterium]
MERTASATARMRVRGDRPARGSIHGGWSPPAYEPDGEDRAALAAFEASRSVLVQTIVAIAPEPWMTSLRKPDLPLRWNRGLLDYLEYFTKDERGRALMRAWLRRAGRYEDRIRKILREHEVPEDLVWVVMAESGFNPRVRSAVGAAGPWQFMEGTGGVYGLTKTFWIDERHDIERASHAAAEYLADLRVRFGSWELALAAYNAGYGLVMTAIERHNTNNFWALAEIESGLPHATVNYVPKIVAAALVARNRDHFGFGARALEPMPAADWVEVELQHSVTLATLARTLEVDLDLLQEWNARLIRGRTPPGRGRTMVRIPRDRAQAFAAARAEILRAHEGEGTIVAREGERLEALARRGGIGEKELRKRNGIEDAAEVTGGVTLVVPGDGTPTAAPEGPRPLAAVPPCPHRDDERLVFFEVTRASTPAAIARAFGTTWERVVQWNDLDPSARLQPGQLLQLVVPRSWKGSEPPSAFLELDQVEHVARGSRAHLEAELARRGKLRRAVKASKGDTLERIGKRFGLTTGDLSRINGYAREHKPELGELVIVYVDANAKRGTLDAPAPRGPTASFDPAGDDAPAREAAAPDATAASPDRDAAAELPAVAEPAPRTTAAESGRGTPAGDKPRGRSGRSRRTRRHDASTAGTSRIPGQRDGAK